MAVTEALAGSLPPETGLATRSHAACPPGRSRRRTPHRPCRSAGMEAAAAWPRQQPALHHNHRFVARCRAAPRHEFVVLFHALDVERMARVPGIAAQEIEHVAEIDVGVFPGTPKWEKPMPRDPAQSSMAVTSAPDCETKASSRDGPDVREAGVQAQVGRQHADAVGSRMRRVCRRAASSMACFWALSSPAVTTMRGACAASAPSSAMSGATVAAGVQITASSGASGSAFSVGTRRSAAQLGVFGVDGVQVPGELGAQVVPHRAPTLAGRSKRQTPPPSRVRKGRQGFECSCCLVPFAGCHEGDECRAHGFFDRHVDDWRSPAAWHEHGVAPDHVAHGQVHRHPVVKVAQSLVANP